MHLLSTPQAAPKSKTLPLNLDLMQCIEFLFLLTIMAFSYQL